MSKFKLVITEKPSTAQAISAVLNANKREDDPSRADSYFIGNGYIVSWCAGHLLELASPDMYDEKYKKWRYSDLPIIPESWKYVPAKGKENQLEVVTKLMNRPDVKCIINACDAGREGENIFNLVRDFAKCTKKVYRLWISSMEESAIRAGFAAMKDGESYNNLYAAATCRERADWVCGISATRLISVLYGTTLNVGRVQSPTLAMLVKRENDISNFVKEPFYIPVVNMGEFTAYGEKLKDKSEAKLICGFCNGATAVVQSIERQRKTVSPPNLFNLTALQREANRLFGFTAKQTLDYTQSLYEKRLLSYPRSNGKFITEDMRDSVMKIIGDFNFTPNIERIIGSVSEHHAIIPTLEIINADTATLPKGERSILELVRKKLTAAVSPKHVYEAVTATLNCGNYTFKTKGKNVIENGWKSIENNDDKDENPLPELSQGQEFQSVIAYVKEGSTSPPKHHTDDSILLFMEKAGQHNDFNENPPPECVGIGTSATRDATLEKLIKSGFVERQTRNLIPTEKGKNLIAILPESLTSPKLTSEWENKLKQVELGELSMQNFMDEISEFIKSIVAENSTPKPEFANLFGGRQSDFPALGNCPRCNSAVRESAAKGFFCDNHLCGFKLWKESKFWTAKRKPLTAEIVTELLKNGRVSLGNLYSEKTGKSYSAIVILDDDGGKFVNFKMEFSKAKGRA